MRRWRSELGWTLIELTIVISLIAVLSTIALAGYRSAITGTKEAVLKEDLFRMRDAIDQYYADRGQYPVGLGALVTDGYLRSIPDDPFTNSPDTWLPVLSDIDEAGPAFQGVYDVKSGSNGMAIDGTRYAEW